MRRFPPGFLWGVATSAYQIEGAAREDGRGESIWDRFARVPGAVERSENGDVACDHYRRWRADLDLMKRLGVTSYRFSIAWPRVYPDGRGAANPRGLDFYRRLVEGLRERGIVPMATLYHWDLPQGLEDRGGWRARETAERFAEFARTMFDALDGVSLWATHNEPWCAAFLGHWHGAHAPGARDFRAAVLAAHHILYSHGLAVRAFRASGARGEIGIVLNLAPQDPASGSEDDRAAATAADGHHNRWFLDPLFRGRYPEDVLRQYARLAGPLDFIEPADLDAVSAPTDYLGVNYYSARTVRADAASPLGWTGVRAGTGADVPSDGWERAPDGLTRLLTRLREDYGPRPLYVTENGFGAEERAGDAASLNDERRIAYLRAHLAAAHEAIAAGVDLRGYYLWSLLDNFEWSFGYRIRFGIVHVDFATQRRRPKASAFFYSGVIARNALVNEDADHGRSRLAG